jgi:general secretion pathway protein F
MKFTIKTLQNNAVTMLAMDAPNAAVARSQAEMQGWQVLSVKGAAYSLPSLLSGESRKQKFNVTLFSQELLALLESGLSLIEAIEALAEKEQQAQAQIVFKQITTALYEGLPLSNALEQAPQIFTPLYVALIRASERTGDMPQALRRHVTYQAQIDVIRKKIVSASIYPVLLLVVGGLVVLFLLGYVIPKFSGIYESTGADLPWASQMLLKWGQLLQTHGREVLFATISLFALLGAVFTRPQTRAWLTKKLWQIPALGDAMRIYQLARFYRTLGMLLQGGIPLTTAMGMVNSLLPANLRAALNLALSDVRDGKPLSSAMEQHGLTTSISIRMLRVGERTGQMDEMLERIGVFYDDETARKVEWFTKLLEPILMLLIGLIVGLVVVLMYMPIFELAGDIQ